MSENYRLQISPKIGDTLVNLRAETTEEMQQLLAWARDNAVHITNALDTIRGVSAVAQAMPGTQVVSSETVPQQAQRAAQAVQGTQRYAPNPSGPPAPTCQHGARVYKEGVNKKGGTYKAWFCPSNDRNTQCPAQWL